MAQEIQVDIKLPGNAARKLELAALAARKFGRPDKVLSKDDTQIDNPMPPLEYIEGYFEQALADVLTVEVGSIVAEAAAKTEREKPDNQFKKRQR